MSPHFSVPSASPRARSVLEKRRMTFSLGWILLSRDQATGPLRTPFRLPAQDRRTATEDWPEPFIEIQPVGLHRPVLARRAARRIEEHRIFNDQDQAKPTTFVGRMHDLLEAAPFEFRIIVDQEVEPVSVERLSFDRASEYFDREVGL